MKKNVIPVMWDALLYAVNMFYYHWLIKKLIWPVVRMEPDGKSKERYSEKEGGVRETPAGKQDVR